MTLPTPARPLSSAVPSTVAPGGASPLEDLMTRTAAQQADHDDYQARRAAIAGGTMSRRRSGPTLVEGETPTIDRPPAREVLGTVEQRLRCPLTPEEVAARAGELADKVGLLDQLYQDNAAAEEAAKYAKKARAAAEAAAERECASLSHDVRTRSETRPVECEEIIDWSKRIVEISRIDTGEVVGTRSITDADRQKTLPAKRRESDDDNADRL